MPLTSHRLSKDLYGRKKEYSSLIERFDHVCEQQTPELVLFSGEPGTGKTTLAHSARKIDGCFFASARFPETTDKDNDTDGQELYPVYSEALMEYVDQLLTSKDVDEEQVRRVAHHAVGDEREVVVAAIPALSRLLDAKIKARSRRQSCFGSESQDRLRQVLSRLVQALTTFVPLVLFFDDIQWADTASMDMLRTLLEYGIDHGSMRCLVVAATRDEVRPHSDKPMIDQEHPRLDDSKDGFRATVLRPSQFTLSDMEEDGRVPIRTFVLKDLTKEDVREMMRGHLRKSADDLADLVFERTQGKLLDIVQVLRILFDQGYLVCDDQHGWQWDFSVVSNDFQSTEGILEVIQRSILQISRISREALKVASILGDEVDDSALDLCLQTNTGSYLEEAAKAGLLVFYPEYGGYCFAHNWVRQSAYDLIPEEEREEFHLRTGRKLWKSSSRTVVDKNIFVVVSLLNRGAKLIDDERQRHRLAEMNLQAGEKAVSLSVFADASRFLRKGIQLLGPDKWQDHYEVALGLYSAAAEVEVCNGQYERVVSYIEEVIHHARCVEDKIRAYVALIQSMGQQDNMLEATKVGVDVLQQIGEPLPKPSKFSVTKQLMNVKLAMKRRSTEDIIRLPKLRDPNCIARLKLLNLIYVYSYLSRSPYNALVALRSVLLTLEYGLHPSSAVGFATYGVLLCGSGGDVNAAYKSGQLAVAIAEKTQARTSLPMVHHLLGMGITHWTRPLRESIGQLTFAARIGLEVGDNDLAVLAEMCRCVYCVFSGTSLAVMREELEQCVKMSRLYRKRSFELGALMVLQLVHCYGGRTQDPSRLTGSVINFDAVMQEFTETVSVSFTAMLYFFALELAYAFADYDFAHEMAKGLRSVDGSSSTSAQFLKVEKEYKLALAAIALARKGVNKRKNTKLARSVRKKMETWARDSPRTYGQKLLLLKAELMTLQAHAKPTTVLAVYDEALEIAKKEGYTNEAALIEERAGDYLFSGASDATAAFGRWEQATRFYAKWCSKAKVEQLRGKASALGAIKKDSYATDVSLS